jgi:hypothetical protein
MFEEFCISLKSYVENEESGDHRLVASSAILEKAAPEEIMDLMEISDIVALFSGRVSVVLRGDTYEMIWAENDEKIKLFFEAIGSRVIFIEDMTGILVRATKTDGIRNLLFKPKGGGR